jgi:ABC-type glycerol-3-phosphate transport system substrate-binding protein
MKSSCLLILMGGLALSGWAQAPASAAGGGKPSISPPPARTAPQSSPKPTLTETEKLALSVPLQQMQAIANDFQKANPGFHLSFKLDVEADLPNLPKK